jgi:hypothetical protein
MLRRLWRNWRNRRRAVAEARRILGRPEYAGRVTPRQKQELLALRAYFCREKMGKSWDERLNLYLLAASLPPEARIVEIGAWVGVGTAYLGCGLRAGQGGQIYAVDTFKGDTLNPETAAAWQKSSAGLGGGTLATFNKHISAFHLEMMVSPLVRTSVEAARQWSGDPIHLLYMDGDHVYNMVKADYDHWAGFVPPGGWIVFHDYDERHPDVTRLVNEVLAGDLAGKETRLVDSLLMIRR